jgi:hypothetical protein
MKPWQCLDLLTVAFCLGLISVLSREQKHSFAVDKPCHVGDRMVLDGKYYLCAGNDWDPK